LKKYDAALTDCNKAVSLTPDDAECYFSRGYVNQAMNNLDAALADYSKAIELKPDYSYYYFLRGRIYDKLKQYTLAIADYTKAIELEPKNYTLYSLRAIAKLYNGQFDNVIPDWDKAIELNSTNAFNYLWRGKSYYFLAEFDKARQDLQKCLQMSEASCPIEVAHDEAKAALNSLELMAKMLKINSACAVYLPSYLQAEEIAHHGDAYTALTKYLEVAGKAADAKDAATAVMAFLGAAEQERIKGWTDDCKTALEAAAQLDRGLFSTILSRRYPRLAEMAKSI
jgi:tetratricopeptide (TPR) repeat protein